VANFRVKFTSSALDDIAPFKKRVRKAILDGIGKYRVFYDVRQSDRIVEVKMIGEKRGNMVLVRGEEYEL